MEGGGLEARGGRGLITCSSCFVDSPFEFRVAVVRWGFRGKDGDVYVVEVGATDDVVVGYDVA